MSLHPLGAGDVPGLHVNLNQTIKEPVGFVRRELRTLAIHSPFLNVASGWYRFRVLNGSTARVYNLALNGLPLHTIGSDGGLLREPETVSNIMLGPGERADLLIDFSAQPIGKEFYLVSNKFSQYNVQGRQSFSIMKFKVDRASTSTYILPALMSSIPMPDPSQSVATRTFDIAAMTGGEGGHGGMGRHAINGKIFEMDRVDETVQAGTTEVWEFDNLAGDEIHPMHVHGVQFQILERIGGRNQIMPRRERLERYRSFKAGRESESNHDIPNVHRCVCSSLPQS